METAIITRELGKSFPMGGGRELPVLKSVEMEIPRGRLTVLRGRSGSGKTTLLNLLSSLDEPTSGEVLFFGQKLSQLSAQEREKLRRSQMGFVFQSVALAPIMSAYENVDFALRLAGFTGDRDARIRQVMERVGLLKRMGHMANQLSGGEQQRVAVARALVHRPKVIFADEPTGALDTASGLAVMQLFREIVETEGTTIVMTTHDPNLMELGDTIFEIEDGVLIA